VWFVRASTLDINLAPSAESMFVWTENSEIQCLISVRMDGNEVLNLAIFCPKFSGRTENRELLYLISIRADGK